MVSTNMASSSTTLNVNQSLYYFNTNLGLVSPSVSCNTATNCNTGFEFNSVNSTTASPFCTYWRGNSMGDLKMGMKLSATTGIIGPQGANLGAGAAPSDNKWLGIWTGNNGVYADQSNALFSPITTKTGIPWTIPAASGIGGLPSQYYGAIGTIFTFSLGDYACGDFSTNRTVTTTPTYHTETDLYIANTAKYRFLHFNDSLRAANATFNNFYIDRADSSYATFMAVEDFLYAGNLEDALDLNSAISPGNAVETNYKNYYAFYLLFAVNGFEPTDATDSTDLLALASLCPYQDGAVIYQARALFNLLYKNSFVFTEACEDTEERKAISFMNKETASTASKIEIFPNPASDQLTVLNSNDTEFIHIVIRDLSNRIVYKNKVKTNHFIANLELALVNGAYLITVINEKNETLTKKLLISK